MYKVNNTLTSAYGNPMDMQDLKPKQGPVSVLIYLIFKVPWDQFLGPMRPIISAYGNPMNMQDLKPKQGPVSVLICLI